MIRKSPRRSRLGSRATKAGDANPKSKANTPRKLACHNGNSTMLCSPMMARTPRAQQRTGVSRSHCTRYSQSASGTATQRKPAIPVSARSCRNRLWLWRSRPAGTEPGKSIDNSSARQAYSPNPTPRVGFERHNPHEYRKGWMMFLSKPTLGVGFGEYAWRALELSMDFPGSVPAGLDRHSHNLFLQLLAETGIAGFLCVAVPLAFWLYRVPWLRLTPERCWALGVLAIMGLHSMVEFPLWHANFLGVFALLFGLASPAFVALDPSRLRRGLFLIILIAGSLTARGVWSDYRDFERWYLEIQAKAARGERSGEKDFETLMALQENGSFFSPYFERLL